MGMHNLATEWNNNFSKSSNPPVTTGKKNWNRNCKLIQQCIRTPLIGIFSSNDPVNNSPYALQSRVRERVYCFQLLVIHSLSIIIILEIYRNLKRSTNLICRWRFNPVQILDCQQWRMTADVVGIMKLWRWMKQIVYKNVFVCIKLKIVC